MERFGSDIFFDFLLFWGDFQVPALQFRGRAPAGICRFSIEILVASWYFHISNAKKPGCVGPNRVYVGDEKLPGYIIWDYFIHHDKNPYTPED